MSEIEPWNWVFVINVPLVIEICIKLVVFLVVLLIAISVHEAAHAWVSYKFGDNTAHLLGRVTLNPRKHVDPIGTLLLPVFAFFAGNLGLKIPVIGWGRPTPVDPRKWTNYRWGNFSVSIAGVAANLILVIFGIIVAKILMTQGVSSSAFFVDTAKLVAPNGSFVWLSILVLFTGQLMWQNISLLIFNLLPIPPLDGGNILGGFLPDNFKPSLDFIKRFGYIILLLLIYFGVFQRIVSVFLFILESLLGLI